MMVRKTTANADAFGKSTALPEGGRLRHFRIIRDYGMFDRREAPQYYPAAERRMTVAFRLYRQSRKYEIASARVRAVTPNC
jgi:hypothetical protein